MTAERVCFQCSKALARPDLWNPDKRVGRETVLTAVTIITGIIDGQPGGAEHDRADLERLKSAIY